MSIRSSLGLLRVPSFAVALSAILLAILAEAIGGSYMALLAVEKIGMSPLELSAFLTLSAISGIAVTTLFGRLHDRRPVLWPLLLSLSAKIAGYALCAVVTEAWMLLAIAFVLFGLGSASFSLLFAIAKGRLDLVGGGIVAPGMASLRMTASLGWAVGPAVGAGLVALWRFEGVYLGATALAIAALATVLASGLKVPPATGGEPPRLDIGALRAVAPAALALTAFHTAMYMASNAMSIVVVRELGTETDVGLLYSLCAALEVVVMGLFVVRPVQQSRTNLLLAGFLVFAAYFLAALLVPTLLSLYVGQILRAVAIAIISILGMSYVQDLLPGRTGMASALFGNTMSAGSLLSGVGTGAWAGAFGYWSIFGLSAALSLGGAAAVAFGRRRVTR